MDGGALRYSRCAAGMLGTEPTWTFRLFGSVAWIYAFFIMFSTEFAVRTALPLLRMDTADNMLIMLFLFALHLGSYLGAGLLDPGVVKDDDAKDAAAGASIKHAALCPSCKVRRPIRSMHSPWPQVQCCVRRYDHHSIWTNNAVGAGNHRVFVLFALSGFLHLAVVLGLNIALAASGRAFGRGQGIVLALFLVVPFAAVFLLYLLHQLLTQFRAISANITLDERERKGRLMYFSAPGVRYYNPFDRGFRGNWLEFLGLGTAGTRWMEDRRYSLWDMPDHPYYPEMLAAHREREAQRQQQQQQQQQQQLSAGGAAGGAASLNPSAVSNPAAATAAAAAAAAAAEPPSVLASVPKGVEPGQQFQIVYEGFGFLVACPPGCKEGSLIKVQIPREALEQQRAAAAQRSKTARRVGGGEAGGGAGGGGGRGGHGGHSHGHSHHGSAGGRGGLGRKPSVEGAGVGLF
eukprot:g5064.t1